jgi:hypothetical protein
VPRGGAESVKPFQRGADRAEVSVTLSPPLRVGALVGALALTGVAAFLFLLGRGATSDSGATTPTITHPAKTAPATGTRPAPTVKQHAAVRRVRLAPGLPKPVAHALRYNRVAVVAVYVPGAPVDKIVIGEARAAAKTSHAGLVTIGASSDTALTRLFAKTGVLPDPAVVVMRRPGVVVAKLGVVDRETIAAAIFEAKHRR